MESDAKNAKELVGRLEQQLRDTKRTSMVGDEMVPMRGALCVAASAFELGTRETRKAAVANSRLADVVSICAAILLGKQARTMMLPDGSSEVRQAVATAIEIVSAVSDVLVPTESNG